MESSLIDKILPIYHKAPKKRHDLLCIDLSNTDDLAEIGIETIEACVNKIESLVSDSVQIATDELYGGITRQEALDKIKALSPQVSESGLEIIFERASYYARR